MEAKDKVLGDAPLVRGVCLTCVAVILENGSCAVRLGSITAKKTQSEATPAPSPTKRSVIVHHTFSSSIHRSCGRTDKQSDQRQCKGLRV